MMDKLHEISADIAEIKADLKYHIKRTDSLEEMVTPTYKLYVFLKYAVAALSPLATAVGLYFLLKK